MVQREITKQLLSKSLSLSLKSTELVSVPRCDGSFCVLVVGGGKKAQALRCKYLPRFMIISNLFLSLAHTYSWALAQRECGEKPQYVVFAPAAYKYIFILNMRSH
jgi:hypothetical protein